MEFTRFFVVCLIDWCYLSGTLYKYLDNCVTSSGKRLLRNWICHPLNDVEKINLRLNVVEELMAHSELGLLIAQHLRKLPDLERLLGRIKATIRSSALLLLPLIGNKILKQRVSPLSLFLYISKYIYTYLWRHHAYVTTLLYLCIWYYLNLFRKY